MSDRQLIVVIVALGLLAAAVWLSWLLRERRKEAWHRFARRHALRAVPTEDEVSDFAGPVGGRQVTLRHRDKGSDTGTLGVTVVVLGVALSGPRPQALRVEAGTPLDPLLMSDDEEAHRVDTGDADFDARVRVSARDDEAARSYLTAARKAAISRLLDEYPSAHSGIRDGRVQVAMREVVARASRLEECLALLQEIAPVLDGETPGGD